MSASALRVLDFGKVLEYVAGFAATRGGREAVLALRPSSEPDRVRGRLAAVDETRRFLSTRDDWVFPSVPEAGTAIGTVTLPVALRVTSPPPAAPSTRRAPFWTPRAGTLPAFVAS